MGMSDSRDGTPRAIVLIVMKGRTLNCKQFREDLQRGRIWYCLATSTSALASRLS